MGSRSEHAGRGHVGRPAGVEARASYVPMSSAGTSGGSLSASANALRLAPSTRAEVVDRQHDPVAAGPLARAHDRPAQRLGRGEPALFRREPGAALGACVIEHVGESAAGLGRGGDPVAWAPSGDRQAREVDDRTPERPVADLRPRRIGTGLHDDVARRRGELEELAHQPRLADADVADDACAGQRARLPATCLEPRQIVLSPDERQGPRELRPRLRGAARPTRRREATRDPPSYEAAPSSSSCPWSRVRTRRRTSARPG